MLRYRWICAWVNSTHTRECGAKSTNAFPTSAAARAAARGHRCKGQDQGGPVIEIVDLFAKPRRPQ